MKAMFESKAPVLKKKNSKRNDMFIIILQKFLQQILSGRLLLVIMVRLKK